MASPFDPDMVDYNFKTTKGTYRVKIDAALKSDKQSMSELTPKYLLEQMLYGHQRGPNAKKATPFHRRKWSVKTIISAAAKGFGKLALWDGNNFHAFLLHWENKDDCKSRWTRIYKVPFVGKTYDVASGQAPLEQMQMRLNALTAMVEGVAADDEYEEEILSFDAPGEEEDEVNDSTEALDTVHLDSATVKRRLDFGEAEKGKPAPKRSRRH